MAGVQGECLLETQAAILDKFLQKFMRIPKKEEQDGIKQEEEEEEQEEEEDDKGEMAGMSESQLAEKCRCSVGGWTNPLSGVHIPPSLHSGWSLCIASNLDHTSVLGKSDLPLTSVCFCFSNLEIIV